MRRVLICRLNTGSFVAGLLLFILSCSATNIRLHKSAVYGEGMNLGQNSGVIRVLVEVERRKVNGGDVKELRND